VRVEAPAPAVAAVWEGVTTSEMSERGGAVRVEAPAPAIAAVWEGATTSEMPERSGAVRVEAPAAAVAADGGRDRERLLRLQ
jgi:hypothetical protein